MSIDERGRMASTFQHRSFGLETVDVKAGNHD